MRRETKRDWSNKGKVIKRSGTSMGNQVTLRRCSEGQRRIEDQQRASEVKQTKTLIKDGAEADRCKEIDMS